MTFHGVFPLKRNAPLKPASSARRRSPSAADPLMQSRVRTLKSPFSFSIYRGTRSWERPASR